MASRVPPMKDQTTPTVQTPAQQDTPVVTAPSNTRVPDLPPKKSAQISSGDTGNSFWYDLFHPSAADLSRPQTWRDWATKTYSPAGQDWANAALDDISFGTADIIQAGYGGGDLDEIRKRTAASQAALGPMGPVLNALTYVAPGVGAGRVLGPLAKKTASVLGRYGAAGLEGATASGTSSVGHQILGKEGIDWGKVAKDTALGTVFSIGGQVAGDIMAPVVQPKRTGGDPIWEDMRARALAGKNIEPDLSTVNPPNAAARQAVQNVRDAAAMSTRPGWMANTVGGAGTLGTGAYGLLKTGDPWGALGFSTLAGSANAKYLYPAARAINTADRNINVNQAFDMGYPAFGLPPVTTNVEPWRDAFRQLAIGSVR